MFLQAAYVLFGKQIPSYGTFVGTIESLFAFSLGDFDFYAFQKAQKVCDCAAIYVLYKLLCFVSQNLTNSKLCVMV